MVELLSPAGNFEKMRSAIRFGADAVYLSGKAFGMRAAADNFTDEELEDAVAYAHNRNVKVYVAVNVMPREYEYEALRRYLLFLGKIKPDALIVADLGVLSLAKECIPQIPLHISTQASAVSSAVCNAYYALGASRIVLSRELTLKEIKEIRAHIPKDLELEAFIHGSMCISYSGRCLLSHYLIGRDANHGMCAQPCRWNYTIRERHFELLEEKRPDIPIPIEEINGETFFMSSKDTSMIRHVPELIEAGINSFKIEGRVKSAYYAAAVTNAYRMAISAYEEGKPFDPAWEKEVESVAHRPYHTGYYFDRACENANVTEIGGYIKEKAYFATVLSYDQETKLAFCEQKNKFSIGESAQCLTPGQVGKSFTVRELFDENNTPVESVPHAKMKFYLRMPFACETGDIIRAGEENKNA